MTEKNGVSRKQVSKISYIFINFYLKQVSYVVKTCKMKVNKLQTYGIDRLLNKVFYFSCDGRKDNGDEASR